MISFREEKFRKESLWKRGFQFWQPCWYFLSKIHRFKFLKGSAHFLRENTTLLTFFSEKKQSPWKSSSRQKKRIFTVGSRFIAKLLQFSAQELKRTQKPSFFQKKTKCPSKHSFGHRDAFSIITPKNDKKTKIPLKIWIEIFIGFFLGEHVFPQRSLRKRTVKFWKLCW